MSQSQIGREVFLSALQPGDEFRWFGQTYCLREWMRDPVYGGHYAICTDDRYRIRDLKAHALVTIVR